MSGSPVATEVVMVDVRWVGVVSSGLGCGTPSFDGDDLEAIVLDQ